MKRNWIKICSVMVFCGWLAGSIDVSGSPALLVKAAMCGAMP
jgi:hypothetical protein